MGSPLSEVDAAVEALARGGVVVIPTDTVYGLAATVEHPEAIRRIFELKGRPLGQALQVLVADLGALDRVGRPNESARLLARRYWPGPLTIVVAAGVDAPPAVTSDGTIGLRFPAHPLTRSIVKRTGLLAATSANRSGEATPENLSSIRAVFGAEIDAYVDGGRMEGVASTVVDTTGSTTRVVREGAISADEIRRALEFGFEAE